LVPVEAEVDSAGGAISEAVGGKQTNHHGGQQGHRGQI
jgi:hypothetical protein